MVAFLEVVDPLLGIAGPVHHVIHYQASTGFSEVGPVGPKMLKRASQVAAPALKHLAHAINTCVRGVEVLAVRAEILQLVEFTPFLVDVASRSVCPHRLAVEEAYISKSGLHVQVEPCPVPVSVLNLLDIGFEQ